MAVFTEESARANVRVRDGRRVFYLDSRDHLTPAAREWLRRDGVEILPAAEAQVHRYTTLTGAVYEEKPEEMTHLKSDVLVDKTHPRIAFRGAVDTLEAELLLAAHLAVQEQEKRLAENLSEILALVRRLIRCDVLDEPVGNFNLCGLSEGELRRRSHLPQQYYDQPHFMPEPTDSRLLLKLNRTRTMARQAELAACRAFRDGEGRCTRRDIVCALNRVSSSVYLLMIQRKKEESHG